MATLVMEHTRQQMATVRGKTMAPAVHDSSRQAVDAPEDVEWFTRVLELEYHGLADFRFYEAPGGSGANGSWGDEGPWRDQPLAAWGEFYIRAGGVVALAQHYGETPAS